MKVEKNSEDRSCISCLPAHVDPPADYRVQLGNTAFGLCDNCVKKLLYLLGTRYE